MQKVKHYILKIKQKNKNIWINRNMNKSEHINSSDDVSSRDLTPKINNLCIYLKCSLKIK